MLGEEVLREGVLGIEKKVVSGSGHRKGRGPRSGWMWFVQVALFQWQGEEG